MSDYFSPRPILVADQAQRATAHHGPCAGCGYAMLAGDRVAQLADGTGTIHVSCAASYQPRRERARTRR